MTDIATDQSLLTQAYLYGFPLVFNLDQVTRYVTDGVGANPAAPFNTFSHARHLAGPADTFVTINNDTVYSMAQIDLSVGPVALHVPDTAGRYYVLQFVDAWTNNFAYVGHRATGTGEGDFLLVPPTWNESVPAGTTIIRFPTTVASIVGRWSVASDEDLPVVHALQDATTLTPVDSSAVAVGLGLPDPAVPEELMFLEKLRVWSQQFPPAARDVPLQHSLAAVGTAEAGRSPYTGLLPATAAGLESGLAGGKAALTTTAGSPGTTGRPLLLLVHRQSCCRHFRRTLRRPEAQVPGWFSSTERPGKNRMPQAAGPNFRWEVPVGGEVGSGIVTMCRRGTRHAQDPRMISVTPTATHHCRNWRQL